jgi:hypothetical protein
MTRSDIPKPHWSKSWTTILQRGRELGITSVLGEAPSAYCQRVLVADRNATRAKPAEPRRAALKARDSRVERWLVRDAQGNITAVKFARREIVPVRPDLFSIVRALRGLGYTALVLGALIGAHEDSVMAVGQDPGRLMRADHTLLLWKIWKAVAEAHEYDPYRPQDYMQPIRRTKRTK